MCVVGSAHIKGSMSRSNPRVGRINDANDNETAQYCVGNFQ